MFYGPHFIEFQSKDEQVTNRSVKKSVAPGLSDNPGDEKVAIKTPSSVTKASRSRSNSRLEGKRRGHLGKKTVTKKRKKHSVS